MSVLSRTLPPGPAGRPREDRQIAPCAVSAKCGRACQSHRACACVGSESFTLASPRALEAEHWMHTTHWCTGARHDVHRAPLTHRAMHGAASLREMCRRCNGKLGQVPGMGTSKATPPCHESRACKHTPRTPTISWPATSQMERDRLALSASRLLSPCTAPPLTTPVACRQWRGIPSTSRAACAR